MRRPAGESRAPSGPPSSWKRSADPSGSDAVNWKTKFSPANVWSLFCGWWKVGGLLTEDRGGKKWRRYSGFLQPHGSRFASPADKIDFLLSLGLENK